MKTLRTICLVFCIIAGFCFSLYSESENLVMNGDFEDLYVDLPNFWAKDAWLTSGETRYYIEKDNPHSGNQYMTIQNIRSNDARLVQQVEVKPLTFYRLSAWVKVEGCDSNKTGANISIMDAESASSKDIRNDTEGNWVYIEYNVRTGTEQTTMSVAIRLGGFGNDNVGKASFDDFRLEEITDPTGVSAFNLKKKDDIGLQEVSSINTKLLFIIFAISFFIITGGLLLYIIVLKPRLEKESSSLRSGKAVYTTKDWILAGSLTIIYAVVAFTNLGSFKAPQTFWKPSSNGENIVVDFGSVQNVRRIYYYHGLPGGHGPDAQYGFDYYSEEKEKWLYIGSTEEKPTIYYWYYLTTDVMTRKIKITVRKPRSWLNEVVFTGEDKVPIKIVDVKGEIKKSSVGDINNLFDEQDTIGVRPNHFTGMSPGFDEQYHARTAMEHIVLDDPYEDTHPPLGKLLMAVGILIFGMVPFGWRFMGTLIGVLMVPVMYAFGKDLFKKSEYAFFASFLMAVDFMHFTQTRIATIDSYGVFFIILMFFFMHKHYKMSYFTTDFKKTLIPLFLSGICFGLGCASKWIAVHPVAGLLLIGIVSLIKKGAEYSKMKKKLSSKTLKKNRAEWKRIKRIVDKCPQYIMITLVVAVVVCFLIIPFVLYFLSFVPLWFVPVIQRSHPTFIHWVLDTINGMIDYHAKTIQPHSFASKWYEWPPMTRPMWYHVPDEVPPGQTQRLFCFGNPAIWWIGSLLIIPALLMAIYGFFKRLSTNIKEAPKNMRGGKIMMAFINDTRYKNEALFIILVGFISNYAFWIVSLRVLTFIYHYFASVPFVILCVVALIKYVREKHISKIDVNAGIKEKILYYSSNGAIYAYLLLALVLFIMFYPIIAGVPFDINYIRTFLKWLPGWFFA